jgi:hypothetical protein
MRAVIASLLLLLVIVAVAHAEGAWVLWTRTCDLRSQVCDGQWQRGATYEAERWCRAARSNAVNHGLTDEGRRVAARRGTVLEYQCFPDTVVPPGPKGTK